MFFLANKLFTIGQFAKMHQINKTTLMWYDKIGLLKPSIIQKNGYRFYTYRQSYILEMILILRELDIPIYKIKNFLERRTSTNLEELFIAEILEVDDKIVRLISIREQLSKYKEKVGALNRINLSEIQVVNKEKEYLITIEAAKEARFESIIDKFMSTATRYQLKLPFQFSAKNTFIQPGGKYLRAYCKGWDNLEKRYIEILNYASEHNLQLWNYAYEEGINEFFIDTFDDYITQIEIPIKI